MAMPCRYAFPTKVQPVDKRPHSLPVNGLANLIFFVDSHSILSTHRVHGTSAAWCSIGSIVQWYTGSGVPFLFHAHYNYSVVVVIWAFAVSSIWTRLVIGVRCYKIWGTHPALKKHFLFFFLDSHFVVRAIYLPSLFQPLPRWWKTVCSPEETSQASYTWCAKIVGSMCVMCRTFVNPVGDVNFLKV